MDKLKYKNSKVKNINPKKVYNVRKCNRCYSIIKEWVPPAYDPVNHKPVCPICSVYFFYDCSERKWFFSKGYGVYDAKRVRFDKVNGCSKAVKIYE